MLAQPYLVILEIFWPSVSAAVNCVFFHWGNYYFLKKDAFLLLTQSPWLFTYLQIIIFIVCLKSAATAVLTDGNAANSNIQSQDQSFLSAAKTTSAVDQQQEPQEQHCTDTGGPVNTGDHQVC